MDSDGQATLDLDMPRAVEIGCVGLGYLGDVIIPRSACKYPPQPCQEETKIAFR